MQWFKHQSDARNSLKLRKVRRKYGADGYAIYWFCLEAIAYEVNKDNLTFELKEDAETIAFELSIQEKRVEEIMHYMVDIGLFESSSNMITCMKLAESIDKSMTNSPKMRKWLETKSVMTLPDTVNTCAELELEVEVEKKKTIKRFAPPTEEQVFEYMQERDFAHRKESEAFVNFYESKGWLVGKSKMKDWKAAVRNWISRSNLPKTIQHNPQQQQYDHEAARQREIEEIRKGFM